ncbi:MAG: Holliday junction resolvase [Desulfurococcales archaeon]|jgi:Holliday junction resolvase|nr:Holliday junction resolvase [Desulfurococcales archaeon]
MRDNEKILIKRRAFQRERDLARKLWSLGFAVIRGPASGAKTKRVFYPDLVAIKNGKIYIFEIKTREKEENIYVEPFQIEKLKEFSRRSGGRSFVAIKIVKETEWRFIPIELLEKTEKGRYKIDKKYFREGGLTIEDIYRDASGDRPLTEYIRKVSEKS